VHNDVPKINMSLFRLTFLFPLFTNFNFLFKYMFNDNLFSIDFIWRNFYSILNYWFLHNVSLQQYLIY